MARLASLKNILAQRSASADKEIMSLIGDAIMKVDAGSRLADRACATMAQVPPRPES